MEMKGLNSNLTYYISFHRNQNIVEDLIFFPFSSSFKYPNMRIDEKKTNCTFPLLILKYQDDLKA